MYFIDGTYRYKHNRVYENSNMKKEIEIDLHDRWKICSGVTGIENFTQKIAGDTFVNL